MEMNTSNKVTPEDGTPKQKQRGRKPLKWYQKQFGVGFCYGLTVGCGIGSLFVFVVDSLMHLLIG